MQGSYMLASDSGSSTTSSNSSSLVNLQQVGGNGNSSVELSKSASSLISMPNSKMNSLLVTSSERKEFPLILGMEFLTTTSIFQITDKYLQTM